jgi:hypothetical protein
MTIALLIPAALSFVLLAAHFVRSGSALLVLLSLACIGLLFIPRRWAARTVQVLLVLGALEWLRATVVLIDHRMSADDDWLRMAIILVCVALFTGLSALLLQTPRLRRRYRTGALAVSADEESAKLE